MARIRSIHPGFFTDEAIVAASPQAQIFLIGVWTQCDDQGVFEWKPITLKMRILPASNCDVAVLLGELTALGIIRQIDVGPLKYGLVRNFRRYQRPKKPNSTYPLPVEFRTYVGLGATDTGTGTEDGGPSSPPVPHQGGTGPELPPQMEEEGGRKAPAGPSLTPVEKPSPAAARASEPEGLATPHDGKPIALQLKRMPS